MDRTWRLIGLVPVTMALITAGACSEPTANSGGSNAGDSHGDRGSEIREPVYSVRTEPAGPDTGITVHTLLRPGGQVAETLWLAPGMRVTEDGTVSSGGSLGVSLLDAFRVGNSRSARSIMGMTAMSWVTSRVIGRIGEGCPEDPRQCRPDGPVGTFAADWRFRVQAD